MASTDTSVYSMFEFDLSYGYYIGVYQYDTLVPGAEATTGKCEYCKCLEPELLLAITNTSVYSLANMTCHGV